MQVMLPLLRVQHELRGPAQRCRFLPIPPPGPTCIEAASAASTQALSGRAFSRPSAHTTLVKCVTSHAGMCGPLRSHNSDRVSSGGCSCSCASAHRRVDRSCSPRFFTLQQQPNRQPRCKNAHTGHEIVGKSISSMSACQTAETPCQACMLCSTCIVQGASRYIIHCTLPLVQFLPQLLPERRQRHEPKLRQRPQHTAQVAICKPR